jgi:hypothetical protein
MQNKEQSKKQNKKTKTKNKVKNKTKNKNKIFNFSTFVKVYSVRSLNNVLMVSNIHFVTDSFDHT